MVFRVRKQHVEKMSPEWLITPLRNRHSIQNIIVIVAFTFPDVLYSIYVQYGKRKMFPCCHTNVPKSPPALQQINYRPYFIWMPLTVIAGIILEKVKEKVHEQFL